MRRFAVWPKPMANLSEWDQLIAPVLHRIESNASVCRTRAQYVLAEVRHLRSRPDWLTRAQDEMAKAKAELEAALEAITDAERAFQEIPLEKKDG